jgi:integrase
MANKKVALVRKCKVPEEGWRYYPAVMSANGKVKPNTVMVGDVELAYPIGHYALRAYSGSKLVYTRVKGGATEALAALKLAQKRANAVVMASDAGVQIVEDSIRTRLRDSYPRFVQAARDRGSIEAAETYERALEEFLGGCPKTYADELTREDVTRFHVQMKARGLSARTVSNRHFNLRAFLLSLGLNVKVIAGKAPRYDETLPEIYESEELAAFFLSLKSEYDQIIFKLLLTTGLRERELMHLQWIDISFSRRTLQVRSKPQYKHRVKTAEERELPLTKELVAQLQAYRQQLPGGRRLVFGKLGGQDDAPEGHLLRRLKILVKRAGLDCGTCTTCLAKTGCEDWWLHKFRATYITALLRSGMDLRTTMRLSGHADIESVMRYLRPAGTVEVQDRVNAVKWF